MNNRNCSALVSTILLTVQSWFVFPVIAQDQGDALLYLGGKPVKKEEFSYLLSKEKNSDNDISDMSREEFEENLELFVNYKLKVREAEFLGLDQMNEFINEFSSFKESLIAPYLIKNSIEEGELRKVYSRMQEIIRASHILFQFPPNASKEDSLAVLKMALKVREEIVNGGDINELAKTYSDDPLSKINKGDLGYFTGLQMVQPFEDAAFSLQPGKVSDPVLTDFGYHILQVKDRLPNPGQVKVSHILVRYDPQSVDQENNARRKIADIYTEIQKESTIWEDLVKTFSEDQATNQNGGLLPWFGVGTMIPEFELAAFSLTETGEISPPLRTQYGYHILRLEGKKELDSFEELEESIRSRILRESRSSLIQSQVIAIQKSRYGFKENELNYKKLESFFNELSVKSVESALASKEISEIILFTLNGESYSAKELLKFITQEELSLRGKEANLESWYYEFIARILSKTEETDLEANNEEYKMLLKEYRDGILLFSLMNQEVWQKGISDSLGQVDYYKMNPDKFKWGKRIEAFLIRVIDLSKLQDARKIFQSAGYNTKVIKSFEEGYKMNHPLAYTTELGTFEYEDHPILSKVNLDLTYQEYSSGGSTYILVLGKKIPEGVRKFEESRGLVIRDYQEFLEKSLNEKLKIKYPIQINTTIKEEIFKSLNKLN